MDKLNLWLFVIISICFPFNADAASKIIIDRRGRYNSVVISIDEQLYQDPVLIENIKETFTKGSRILYNASHNGESTGLSFGTVYILIPNSWDDTAVDANPTWQRTESADIFVQQLDTVDPITDQPRDCGKPGDRTIYPARFFKTNKINHGKIITHEWAKSRWGVFTEGAQGGHPQFYVAPDENDEPQLIPTSCSDSFSGELVGEDCSIGTNNELPSTCRFVPHKHNNTKEASLMYSTEVESVFKFCDGKTHNFVAPNRFYDCCDEYESVWEILNDHQDFLTSNYRNNDFIPPEFKVIKRVETKDQFITFVLDVSGSMSGIPITNLKLAAIQIIESFPERCIAKIGIVKFESNAETVKKPNCITTEQVRRDYINTINNLPLSVYTAIGNGLITAFEDVGGDPNNPKQFEGNGIFILITDGQENVLQPYSLASATEILEKSGVNVWAVSFGSNTNDNLANLSKRTGGRYVASPISNSYLDLSESILASINSISLKNETITTISKGELQTPDSITGIVWEGEIDGSLGKETNFIFTFGTGTNPGISVRAPDGTVYSRANGTSVYFESTDRSRASIKIPGIAQTGIWTIFVTQSSSVVTFQTQSFSQAFGEYVITSLPVENSTIELVSISSLLDSDILNVVTMQTRVMTAVKVVRESTPVTGARVLVTVGNVNGVKHELQLHDNGLGADSLKGDGYYSGYVLGSMLHQISVYTLTAQVSYVDNATSNSESFQRFYTIGALKVNSFDSQTPDTLPPSRIRDLAVKIVNTTERSVQLSWTAVGDDGDVGTANKYEYRATSNIKRNGTSAPVREFRLQYTPTPPKVALTPQTLTVQIQSNETAVKVAFFAIRAVDSDGNAGRWSMPQSVSFTVPKIAPNIEKPSPIIPPGPFVTPGPIIPPGPFVTPENKGNNPDKDAIPWFVWVICAFVILFMVVITLSIIFNRRRTARRVDAIDLKEV